MARPIGVPVLEHFVPSVELNFTFLIFQVLSRKWRKKPRVQWSLPLNGTAYFVVQTSDGGCAFARGDAGIFFSGAWLAGTNAYSQMASSSSPSPLPSALSTQPPAATFASPSASTGSQNKLAPELVPEVLILTMALVGAVSVFCMLFKHKQEVFS